jgi:hypothetical protein
MNHSPVAKTLKATLPRPRRVPLAEARPWLVYDSAVRLREPLSRAGSKKPTRFNRLFLS